MQARIVTSMRANITRAAIPWQKIRFFHRESKVGGHTVRSVPVRGETSTVEAPAALMNTVVDNEELQDAMTSLHISELTEIQELAYPLILNKKDVMVASHTGSGKTLAYLLPIAQELKRQELDDGFVGKPKRPRVIVLSPTRELTEQIAGVARQLSHHAKLRTVALSTGVKPSQQKRALASPIDILVSTPQHVVKQMTEGSLAISDVQYLVLDEADTIFEGGFGQDVYSVVRPLRKRGTPVATVLVSATMNPQLKQAVEAEFPNMVKAETASLHKGIKGSNHVFMPLQPGQDKLRALFQVLAGVQGKRSMVFCSSISSCRAVDHHLAEGGISTVCFHGAMPIPARKTAIERFTGILDKHHDASHEEDGNGTATDLPAPLQMEDGRSLEEQPVLVCTDLAARGLDMPARVHHVINFDFPSSAKDYLHRSGRTARAGASGTITSLLQTALERTLAGRIEHGLKNNEAIDELTSLSVGGRRGDDGGRGDRGREGTGGRGRSMGNGRSMGRGRGGGVKSWGARSSSQRGSVSDSTRGSNHQWAPKFADGPGKGRGGSSSDKRGGAGWGRGVGQGKDKPLDTTSVSKRFGSGRESTGRGAGRDGRSSGRTGGRFSGGRDSSSSGRGTGRSFGRGRGEGTGGRGSYGSSSFDSDGAGEGGRSGRGSSRPGGSGRFSGGRGASSSGRGAGRSFGRGEGRSFGRGEGRSFGRGEGRSFGRGEGRSFGRGEGMGGRSSGGRSSDDRSSGGRSFGRRNSDDRGEGGRRFGGRSSGARSSGGRGSGGRSFGGRSSGSRSSGGRGPR